MRPAAIHARTNVSDVISSAITTSPHKYSANRRTSLENRSYRFSMSVILFATQVTGEHAKSYIEGTPSRSSERYVWEGCVISLAFLNDLRISEEFWRSRGIFILICTLRGCKQEVIWL